MNKQLDKAITEAVHKRKRLLVINPSAKGIFQAVRRASENLKTTKKAKALGYEGPMRWPHHTSSPAALRNEATLARVLILNEIDGFSEIALLSLADTLDRMTTKPTVIGIITLKRYSELRFDVFLG